MAKEIEAQFWASTEDGPNPYLAWLTYSDVAIVTEDSANMLSDAAWHDLPIHIAKLEGRADKFDRLHQSLIDHGAARWFGGTLETWTYPALKEAGRVADAIVAEMVARHPAPVSFHMIPRKPRRPIGLATKRLKPLRRVHLQAQRAG